MTEVIESTHEASPTGKVVNLTPHDVFVQRDDGSQVVFRCQGKSKAVRLSTPDQTVVDMLPGDVPVYSEPHHYLDLTTFPYDPYDPEGHHPPIIVAGIVAPHIPPWYKGTVLVPDTGPEAAIRNEKGMIVAVRRLYRVDLRDRITETTPIMKEK